MKIYRISQINKLLYIVHPSCIVEKTSNKEYIVNYLNKTLNFAKSFQGTIVLVETDIYNSTIIDSDIKKLLNELMGLSDHVVKEERIDVELGELAMKTIIDDIYLRSVNDNEEFKICVIGCFKGFCITDTVRNLKKQYGDVLEEVPEYIEPTGMVTNEDIQDVANKY